VNLSLKIHPVSQNRIFFFILAGALSLFGTAKAFQQAGFEVTPAAASRAETLPGKILTVSFKVSNNSSSPLKLEPTTVLPVGWRAFRKESQFELASGVVDIRLVSFSIPGETPAGEYQVRYVVKDVASPGAAKEASITVVVSPVRQLELKTLESPRYVLAGERYTSVFLLSNKGNVSGRIRLNARSSGNFTVRLDSNFVNLQPSESRQVTAAVQTDVTVIQRMADVLEVVAARVEDAQATARATSSVEVVPRVSGVEERFFQFPLQVNLRAAGQNGARGEQVEIAGTGSLGEGRRDRLELLIRTPDIQPRSILGQRDEYRIDYKSEAYEVYAGDKNYALTPLTEFNRYAFGAGGRATFSRLTVGGFYNETRFLLPLQKEQAGWLGYRVAEGSEVGLNYMRRLDSTKSDIVSLRSLIRPFQNAEVDLEYGRSSAENYNDQAYAGRVTGRERWISYEARYVWAGSKYAGYYRDLNFQTANLTFMPWGDFRVEGYFRNEERNLARDTSLFVAPRDRYYQVGAGYSDLLAVYYRVNEQTDLLPIPKYSRRDEAVQLRTGHNFADFGFVANADLGAAHDKLLAKNYPFQRYTLSTSFRPASWQSYSVSVEYAKEQNIYTDEKLRRLSGSLSASIFLGAKTQLLFTAYGSRAPDSIQQTYYLMDLTLEHTLPWGHKLTVRGRQSEFTPSFNAKDAAYLFEYSIPIGVPLARIKTSGELRGEVMDLETKTGLPNVLVYANGVTAVTDRNGEFIFPSLRPGPYYIQLDMAKIGLNRVSSQPMPREITIKGGEADRLDMGVIRAATLSGTVLLYASKDSLQVDTTSSPLVELGGHANVVLELSNAVEAQRRISDNRGRFSFVGMRPGQWTLRVIDGNLPANYYIDKESLDVDLPPGGEQEVTLKVLPRKRRIQVITTGKTLVETQPAERKPAERRQVEQPRPTPVPKPAEIRTPEQRQIQPPIAVGQPGPLVVHYPNREAYTIQMSSWETEGKAWQEARRLENATGYYTFVRKIDLPELGVHFRVYVGYFETRALADSAAQELRQDN
jgi:cell division septation protein DedD